MLAPIVRSLDSLGWLDTVSENILLGASARYMPGYCAREHGRSRRERYVPLLRRLDTLVAGAADPLALAVRGRVRSILGDPQAEPDFDSALALDPGCGAAWGYLAEHRLRGGRQSACAREWLDKAIEREPDHGAYRVWKALALCQSGDFAPALAAARSAVERAPRLVTARLVLGLLKERLADRAGAEADYSAAIELDGRCSGIYTLRGTVRMRGGDLPGAVADAHRALDLHPENLETFANLLQLSTGAQPRGVGGARPALLELAETLLRKDPSSAWLPAARAALTDDTQFAQQDRLLTRAIELDGDRAWLWAFLGRARLRDRQACERAVELAPDIGWIRAWRAEWSRRFGSKEDARRDLDEAIRLGPRYPLAYSWRSRLRQESGDLEGAIADLDCCLEELDKDALYRHRVLLERQRGGAAAAQSLELAFGSARRRPSGGPAAPAPPVGPRPDAARLELEPRVELLAALECLSKGTACPMQETSAYLRRALQALEGQQPAGRLLAALRPQDWRYRHGVPWILRLGPAPGLAGCGAEELAPEPSGAEAKGRLLAALRAIAPGFMDFFASESRFYDSLLGQVQAPFQTLDYRAPLRDYLGSLPEHRFHFVMAPLYHGVAAVTDAVCADDGVLDLYCVSGHVAIGPDGEPRLAFDAREMAARAWHQVLHEAVEPLAWPHRAELASVAAGIEPRPGWAAGACSAAGPVVEDIIHAVGCRLTLSVSGESAAAEALRGRSRLGGWVAPLAAALAEYESGRARYPALADFFPRLLEVLRAATRS